jgi:hypothetical protein
MATCGHAAIRRRAVPMLFAGFDVDDVARADPDHFAATPRHEADTVGDVERLALGV